MRERYAERDGDHRAERRAGRYAERRAVRQRVFQKALHRRAAHRERRARKRTHSTRGRRTENTIVALMPVPVPRPARAFHKRPNVSRSGSFTLPSDTHTRSVNTVAAANARYAGRQTPPGVPWFYFLLAQAALSLASTPAMKSASICAPSARRGAGRESSLFCRLRMAPFFTAVTFSQPGAGGDLSSGVGPSPEVPWKWSEYSRGCAQAPALR